MKYIQKNDEPQEIMHWKMRFKKKYHRNPQYEDIAHNQDEKYILKRSLLSEQGGLCCYCCKRIHLKNSHIEHFYPKGEPAYASLSLEYKNLLGSCQGYSDKKENCGHKKPNDFDKNLLISPLETGCETHFKFNSRGRIKAERGDQRAEYTIEVLHLDTEELNAAREAAMWEAGVMEKLTEDECRKLLEKYSRKNEADEYAVFCDAVLYQLQMQLKELTQKAR